MSNIDANEIVNEAIACLDDIELAIEEKSVDVPEETPVSDYDDKIRSILSGEEAFDKGYSEGYDEYRTALWNGIQNNGARTDYSYAFRLWNDLDKIWKPIHNMKPTTASYMFYSAKGELNIPNVCEEQGITIDFSDCTGFTQMGAYSNVTHLGTVNTTSIASISPMCTQMTKLIQVHLILKDDGSQNINGCFTGCLALTDLGIEGAIGKSLTIPSPLTPESMISVVTHLMNYAGTDNELAYKISFTEDCWAALEAYSTAPDGGTWKNYVTNVLGWNV